MRIAYFTQALSSCWNHGFLRGVLHELVLAGHEVSAFEPEASWSRANLVVHRRYGLPRGAGRRGDDAPPARAQRLCLNTLETA